MKCNLENYILWYSYSYSGKKLISSNYQHNFIQKWQKSCVLSLSYLLFYSWSYWTIRTIALLLDFWLFLHIIFSQISYNYLMRILTKNPISLQQNHLLSPETFILQNLMKFIIFIANIPLDLVSFISRLHNLQDLIWKSEEIPTLHISTLCLST